MIFVGVVIRKRKVGTLSEVRVMQQLLRQSRLRLSMAYRFGIVISCVLFLLMTVAQTGVCAPREEIHITVVSASPPRLRIEGKRDVATRIWSFRNAYAGLLGLGERIENLSLTDATGTIVPVRKLAPGEYEAAQEAVGWIYDVRLDPPSLAADSANVSWITADRGFLMLGDLLPRDVDLKGSSDGASLVNLTPPSAWNVFSIEAIQNDGRFVVKNKDDAVFFIGKNLRERLERLGRMEISFVSEGTWAFSDQEVMATVVRILKEYINRVGTIPTPRATLFLSHFPSSVGAQRWSAETRGNTVTLLSGVSPSRVAGLSQLSTPLTHELFHFWVPNGIRLTGKYDWFFEGFTLYESLCVAQRLGFLTFQDYLNAIAKAYDAYSSPSRGHDQSLIASSSTRWTGSTSLVYQKGMLIAFLYDLSLRKLTHGKLNLDDVYRALFQDPTALMEKRDGNQVVLSILRSQGKLQEFVRKYIENSDSVDLQSMLAPFGLTVEQFGARTRIAVSEKLSSRERDLLHAIGYNKEAR